MAELLTQHNRQSFDNFVKRDIKRIMKSNNPIRILKNKQGDEYTTKVKYYIGGLDGEGVVYEKPKANPNSCRLDGKTYEGELRVDVHIIVDQKDTIREYDINIPLIRLPTMLHSSYCNLHKLSSEDLSTAGESPHERGGYFVVKGLEKIILSQEDSANNIVYTRVEGSTGNLIATIDSQFESFAPEKFTLTYDVKTKCIFADIPYFQGSVPLILLFRALGYETEREIIKSICGEDFGSTTSNMLASKLMPSIENIKQIYTQELAMRALAIITKVQVNTSNTNNEKWKGNLLFLLRGRFLPHIPTSDDDYMRSLKDKGAFLGYMTRYLLTTLLKLRPFTDRDSLVYKRVRLPGEIMRDMFREFYEDFTKQAKRITDRMIQVDMKIDITADELTKKLSDLKHKIWNNSEFQMNINKSFMGKWGRTPSSPRNEGVLQSYLRHTFMEAMSHLRRVHLHLPDGPNTMEQRRLHNSQWGYFCPVETPDGGSIGQHKHLAQTCTVSEELSPDELIKWIHTLDNFIKLSSEDVVLYNSNIHNVFVNGNWLGMLKNPDIFVNDFKQKRAKLDDSEVHWSFSITWNIKNSEIRMLTIGGRLMRPLRPNGKPELKKTIELLGCIPEELIKNGCEYIDPSEADTIVVGWNNEDDCTHFEITKTSMFGLTALTLPYIEYNPIARNLYATQQARAAVSVYASNFRSRMDQKASLLHYGQAPLVHTGVVEKLNQNKAPYGINLIVAIAACNGYNQEDAIIINKSAIERGLFVSSYLTTHSVKEDVSVSLNIKDDDDKTKKSSREAGNVHIVNPAFAEKEILNMKKDWDYSQLDKYGVIKKDVLITTKTVLIGSYMIDTNGNWVDNSIVAKNAHKGERVVKAHLSSSLPRVAKVNTREIRFPIVGDKFASRAAQKAVLGIIVPKEDMPYTHDGVVPDIIFNPHSFPSRMTIAYFLEMLTGQIGLLTGRLVEVPNFNSIPNVHEKLMETLHKLDGDPNSERKLYSGTSGKLVCKDACVGPIFYQRLKQMVGDKIYARGGDGPVDAITKQPVGGRARGGGLKSGEMERDALLSHGMSQFVKEMYWDKSDSYEMSIDKHTGNIVPHNPKRNINHGGDVANVQIPYAFKLFMQELRSMNISCKIGVDDPLC